MRKLKLLPILGLLLSLQIKASSDEVVTNENAPPSIESFSNSEILGHVASRLRDGGESYQKYLGFMFFVSKRKECSLKEALKIAMLLKAMGDTRRYESVMTKTKGAIINSDLKISLQHFSGLLGTPSAFEEIQAKLSPQTPKNSSENPFYTSPTSEEEMTFYGNSKKRRYPWPHN